MKQKKVFVLACMFLPLFLLGQGVSMLPSKLSKHLFGSWVNEKNKVVLIITKDYVVVQNEIWYFNDIVKQNNTLNITCVHNFNIKYISITGIDAPTISLDEGYKITQLTKASVNGSNKLPKLLLGNWYDSKNKIELLEDDVHFSENNYKIDYCVSTDGIHYYFVLYDDGDYYFCYNSITDQGHFLNTNFLTELVFKKESFFQKYFLEFIAIIVLCFVIIGYCLFKWKIKITKKKEIVKRKFIEMQLKGIRSQMNPHFLFNALSAIQNLINKGENDKANHYLTEFSQLMRLTLEKSEKGLVPLNDEIKSIKKYIELEKLRFPFNFNLKIDSEIDVHQTEIPAMLIQPFVENAIVHGLKEIEGEKKLSIELLRINETLLCRIADNGIGIENTSAKSETDFKRACYGVKLAKDRIHLINESYKTNATITIMDFSKTNVGQTGTLVEISLPLKY